MLTEKISHFLEAIRFLTVLPLSGASTSGGKLAKSMLFFPLIGLLIGLISLGIFQLFSLFLPPRAAILILVLMPVLFTGGLHLDGFADFCDGFFGNRDRATMLRIMRDSRIGSWGSAGVVFLILAKFELLSSLSSVSLVYLLAMGASRSAQTVLSYALPYAGGEEGLGKSVARKISLTEVMGGFIFLLPVILMMGLKGMILVLGLGVFVALLGLLFKRKLGGVTGDLLGAASELSEIFIFLTAHLILKL